MLLGNFCYNKIIYSRWSITNNFVPKRRRKLRRKKKGIIFTRWLDNHFVHYFRSKFISSSSSLDSFQRQVLYKLWSSGSHAVQADNEDADECTGCINDANDINEDNCNACGDNDNDVPTNWMELHNEGLRPLSVVRWQN